MSLRSTDFHLPETSKRSALYWIQAGACCFFLILSGCTKPIDINVSANEPIKVDLTMDVNVYQHGSADPEEKAARQTYKDVMTSRRNRMEEIRTLKDNRLVGENVEGLLSIRNLPAGEYGTYVKKTVDAENKDRNFLIAYDAEKKEKPVPEVRREQWQHAQRKSFPGEWIQVESESNPGSYKWVQKKGAKVSGETEGSEN